MNNSEGVPVAACTTVVPLTELSQLFGAHHRRVLTAAFRITGNMADAEDVAQAVFLRLANADGPVTNAGSYLYRAAINGALDLLRRRKSDKTEPLESAEYVWAAGSGSSPDAEASARELGALLRIAISELPARAAEMFFLRYVEEHGNREIAALMGTSQAVVAVTLYNARSRLKKRLSEFERGKR
jgi:RNA polymerase sigma-70 factor (ECF subfamily)